jgi:hypothetical protein
MAIRMEVPRQVSYFFRTTPGWLVFSNMDSSNREDGRTRE